MPMFSRHLCCSEKKAGETKMFCVFRRRSDIREWFKTNKSNFKCLHSSRLSSIESQLITFWVIPTHPPVLILANNKQCLSNAMGESPSFYLLIDIGHKYFGSCENVAVVKVNYLLRGGLSTGIWTNCVQIWDKIRDGGSIYIADDSAPPFFLIAFTW